MAKLVALNNAMDTVKKWAAQAKALTFEDNFQTQVQITEVKEGDTLLYDSESTKFLNGIRFKNWDVTFPTLGTMSFTPTTRNINRYAKIGNLVIGILNVTGTTGGVASNIIWATLPVPPRTSGQEVGFARVRDATSGNTVDGLVVPTSGYLACYKTDLTNYGLGTGRIVITTFMYEAL